MTITNNQVELVVLQAGQVVQKYALTADSVRIGREPGNDLAIANPQVSRQHARLFRAGGGWLVENLSQANPVQLRGIPITNPTSIKDGDQLTLCSDIVIQVVMATSPNTGQPVYPPMVGNQSVTAPRPGPSYPTTPPLPQPHPTPTYNQPNGQPSTPNPVVNTSSAQNSAPINTMVIENVPRLTVSYQINYETISREYPLNKSSIRLGRADDNDIVVPIPTVSRLHAVITREGAGSFQMIDQGSTNGLLVRGQHVREHHLTDGDVIRIGDELGNVATLTYQDELRPRLDQTIALKIEPGLAAVTIGRTPDNVLVLDYPQVSAHHAVIRRVQGGAVIEDLGSTNGTFVRGQRVSKSQPMPIQPGEMVQIASYQVRYEENAIVQADGTLVRLDAFNLHKAVGNGAQVLINNISLSIQPREFVAVVGGSGAGKSTLMDALNGFRPAQQGRVFINGDDYYQNFEAYKTGLGYVPQDDIIHRELTVERALYYVARLRLPKDTTKEDIERRISEALADVDMTHRRKLGVNKLSGGQRKRVSIAVELLARPNLFYLDEPTSGLDPGLDKRMMFLLRRLADQGRTVVLVTHSTANIGSCDKVVFLGKGGRLCFYGSPSEARDFFSTPEFSDIYSKLEQNDNSAAEWEDRYRQSPYYQQYITQPLATAPQPQPTAPDGAARVTAPRVSNWRQFNILTRRYAELMVRDRVNLAVLILQAPVIGIVLDLVSGGGIFKTETFSPSAVRVLFILSMAALWLGTSNSAREITKENPIYLRERLVNLKVFPYVMSKVAVLSVLCLIQTILLLGIVFVRTGIPEKGVFLPSALELAIEVFLTTMGGLGLGLMISAIASNTDKAMSLVPIILIPQVILSGVVFTLSGPSKTLSYVTITSWSIQSMGTTANLNELYLDLLRRQAEQGGQIGQFTAGLALASYCPNQADRLQRDLNLGNNKIPAQPGSYQPADYAANPCTDQTFDRLQERQPGYGGDRAGHLLIRLAVLTFWPVLFIGLCCYFQKRKDRAFKS